MEQLRKPLLDGVRVLDLTQFLAGPYGTQILGDLGADIIKVESPAGDGTRHLPPHFVGSDSVYFHSVNRSKRSIVLNLKTVEGRALARELALKSDVVIENFRPGVAARLGLDVQALRAEKPELIWSSISGYGQSGPYRDKPAYDMIIQALSGGMSLTGERGGPAVRAGVPIGDIAAGMYAVIGILAALYRRAVSGTGETVDVAMLDCQVAMTSYQSAYCMHSGKAPGRQGRGHDSIPTYRSFAAGDGVEVVIAANTERMWQALCRVLDCEEMIEDPRYVTNRDRYEHRLDLWSALEAAFSKRSAAEWVRLLEAESIPVGVVNTIDRMVDDPQVRHRGMRFDLTAADGCSVCVMGDPIHLTAARRPMPSFPDRLGESTCVILEEVLGLSGEEIRRFEENGAIAVGSPLRDALRKAEV